VNDIFDTQTRHSSESETSNDGSMLCTVIPSLRRDNAQNATAYGAAPKCTRCTVCTTMQWDFKPSQNSVKLTVEAPKTDATVSQPASPTDTVAVTQTSQSTTVAVPPPKTPEQMQQEAETRLGVITNSKRKLITSETETGSQCFR